MCSRTPQRSGKSATTGRNALVNDTRLLRRKVIERLKAVGFEHVDRVPTTSRMARIPARGKPSSDRSAVVSWSPCGRMLHWIDLIAHEYGTVFDDGRTVQVELDCEDEAVSARGCNRV